MTENKPHENNKIGMQLISEGVRVQLSALAEAVSE